VPLSRTAPVHQINAERLLPLAVTLHSVEEASKTCLYRPI